MAQQSKQSTPNPKANMGPEENAAARQAAQQRKQASGGSGLGAGNREANAFQRAKARQAAQVARDEQSRARRTRVALLALSHPGVISVERKRVKGVPDVEGFQSVVNALLWFAERSPLNISDGKGYSEAASRVTHSDPQRQTVLKNLVGRALKDGGTMAYAERTAKATEETVEVAEVAVAEPQPELVDA